MANVAVAAINRCANDSSKLKIIARVRRYATALISPFTGASQDEESVAGSLLQGIRKALARFLNHSRSRHKTLIASVYSGSATVMLITKPSKFRLSETKSIPMVINPTPYNLRSAYPEFLSHKHAT